MSMILDNPEKVAEIDTEGMCKILERFPEQCEDAINLSKELSIPESIKITSNLSITYRKPKNIIIVGMGGSAISGNLLKDWLKTELSIPIEVYRSYHLPTYADEKTLVLAVSYSGNTEETLSAYLEAIEKKCMPVAITSGGLLQDFSEKLGIPIARLPRSYQPRSAIAHLFFPLVASLGRLELVNCIEEEINEAVGIVKELRNKIRLEMPATLNPSKKLAIGLKGSIPLVCGFGMYESVALRIKTQFNENSKIPAKAEFFPELNHNEIVGWTGSTRLPRNFSIVLIRDDQEATEIRTRVEITSKLVFEKFAKKILEIRASGTGRLARMFSAMYIGDFASFYLAVLYQINPTPIVVIDALKKKFGERVDKTKELRERVKVLKVD